MTMQRTFGADFGLATKVPVSTHRDDPRTCSCCGDSDVSLEDWDSDRDMCESCSEDHAECDECGELCHIDELQQSEARNDHRQLCESCYDDEHVTCTGCGDSVHRDEARTSECGDDWCESCYCDNFTSCDDCGAEIDINSGEYHSDDYGIYCTNCRSHSHGDEWDQDYHWRGCDAYDKLGSSRKFGVELETSYSPDYEDWAHGYGWGAKTDGSTSGMEFVSPPMHGNDGYDSVIDFARRMDRNGCEINRDCGYHVHIDLSDTSKEQRKAIALAYHYTRKQWAKFVDCERRDTFYARYNVDSRHNGSGDWDRDKIMGGDDKPDAYDRYCWANWNAFNRHKTIEIRSHEATCDGRAVINWVKAHIKFVDYVKSMTVGQVTRAFGSEQDGPVMRELAYAWDDAELTKYYKDKGGIE